MTVQDKFTGLMNAVRSVSGTSDLLNVELATKVLTNVEKIDIKINEPYIGSLNDIAHSSLLFAQGEGNAAVSMEKQAAPMDGAWFLVLTIVTRINGGRKWQFAFSDNSARGFLRSYNSGIWTSWNKLGGVRKPALSAFFRPLRGGVAHVA
mgnify:CR=1 FL=1